VIEGITLRPLGYKILIEVLARGRWQRLVEVPHPYEGRHQGDSKLGARQIVEFAAHLAYLVWDTRVRGHASAPVPLRAPRMHTTRR
jgi:dolichol-phosphate mannosyltransferase